MSTSPGLQTLADLAGEIHALAGEYAALDVELAVRLGRIGRRLDIAALALPSVAPPACVYETWAEILRALPRDLRRALIERIIDGQKPPAPPPPLVPELDRRDDLLRIVRQWALAGMSDRSAAETLARALRRAAIRRRPPPDWADEILRLSAGRAPGAETIRKVLRAPLGKPNCEKVVDVPHGSRETRRPTKGRSC